MGRPPALALLKGAQGDVPMAAAAGRPPVLALLKGTQGDVPVAAAARKPKVREQPQPSQGDLGSAGFQVVPRRATWMMTSWIKVLPLPASFAFAAAAFIAFTATQSFRIKPCKFSPANTRQIQVNHAVVPLIPIRHGMACKKFRTHIEPSISPSRKPTRNFYHLPREDCRWHHQLLAVDDVADDMMCIRVLNAMLRVPRFGSINDAASASAQRAVASVTSFMQYSKDNLKCLQSIMAEFHLPWPTTFSWELLKALLEFSQQWCMDAWIQVTLHAAFCRGRTEDPLHNIGKSAEFRAWVALTRTITGGRIGTPASLHCERYDVIMLGLPDISAPQAVELAVAIQDINGRTLEVLGPAIADTEQKIVSMSNCLNAGRCIPFLIEYLYWAWRFSTKNGVNVENLRLLRAVAYILGDTPAWKMLSLIVGVCVVTDVGSMPGQDIYEDTLPIMRLPCSAHTRRCLVQVESNIAVIWSSLLPKNQGIEAPARNVRDILVNVAMRRNRILVRICSKKRMTQRDVEADFDSTVPAPKLGAIFFINWKNLLNVQWRLQHHDLSKVINPKSVLSNVWIVNGAPRANGEFSVFQLHHLDLPLALNYGGAGRLVAKENPQGSLYEPHHCQQYVSLSWLESMQNGLRRHSTILLPESRAFGTAGSLSWRPALTSTQQEYIGDLYGDASRSCNVAAEALREFRAALVCDIPDRCTSACARCSFVLVIWFATEP